MKKVTLRLSNGEEMAFSNVEEIHICESESKSNQDSSNMTHMSTEGKWFQVNPLTIDQTLFVKERVDNKQEATRQIICEAFEELKNNPKYQKPFKIIIPEKTWSIKTAAELIDLANVFGDHIVDWVEQALEWSQRISNGESWEDICNKVDTEKWGRLIMWKEGNLRMVGGAANYKGFSQPPSYVSPYGYHKDMFVEHVVPAVTLYN